MKRDILFESELAFALLEPEQRGPLTLAYAQMAAKVIDRSGLVELIARWEKADQKYRGGARPNLNSRAVLILWLMMLREHEPAQVTWFTSALTTRMTEEVADVLGVRRDSSVSPGAYYDRASRATHRILKLIDDEPLVNRRKRLTKAEYEESNALLRGDPDRIAVLEHRRRRFGNMLLEATAKMLPKRFWPEKVSLVIDATIVPLFAHGRSRAQKEKMDAFGILSIEPDAGYWVREGDHKDDGTKTKDKMKYGMELELPVLVSPDPLQPNLVPNIALGIDQHVPGTDPTGSARRLFDDIVERGYVLDHLIGDRAYFPGARMDVLQNPMRAHGAKIVMDYKSDELGLQAQIEGAILVEGTLYSPSMPKVLINATKDFYKQTQVDAEDNNLTKRERKRRYDEREQKWRDKLKSRETYVVRLKELPKGPKAVYLCPAVGPGATMTCKLKDIHKTRKAGPLNLLPAVNVPPANARGGLCKNSHSVTIDRDKIGKYLQHYAFESEQWRLWYNGPRSAVEVYNAYLKDSTTYGLDVLGRRRLRGMAANFFLSAMTVAAANLEKIAEFLLEIQERENDNALHKVSPLNRSGRSRKSSAAQRVNAYLEKTAYERMKENADPPTILRA